MPLAHLPPWLAGPCPYRRLWQAMVRFLARAREAYPANGPDHLGLQINAGTDKPAHRFGSRSVQRHDVIERVQPSIAQGVKFRTPTDQPARLPRPELR